MNKIKAYIDAIFESLGFNDTTGFLDSTLHLETAHKTSALAVFFGTLATYFEVFFGFSIVIGICIFLLFVLEVWTGVKASRKEGKKFSSKKFNAGFIKVAIYFILIGVTNNLKNHIEVKEVLGYSFNIYEWIHYVIFNFTILQYLISNLENFERLGWNEYAPVLSKVKNVLTLDFKKKPLDLDGNGK